MTGRWLCVVLVLGLAACRTPHKNVSVYSLDDDESSTARQLRAGSDVGETVTGRINLPNYADTETTTNSSVEVESPMAGKPKRLSQDSGLALTRPQNDAGPGREGGVNCIVPDKLPGKSAAQTEVIHLKPGELPPVAQTNPTARLNLRAGFENSGTGVSPVRFPGIAERTGETPVPLSDLNRISGHTLPGHHSPPSTLPASQSIHLSLPAWANSAPRQTAALADLSTGRSVAGAARFVSSSVNLPVGDRWISAGALGAERPVAIPEVGRGATGVVATVAQPVDLAPLLAVAHDADWRERQVDRQRAADTARQAERDGLEKSLQQFLQPVTK